MQYSRDCITITSNNLFFHFQKHPHLRGENLHGLRSTFSDWETSPPAWGKPGIQLDRPVLWGNIPTCVGKTQGRDRGSGRCRKHPHLRGENTRRSSPLSKVRETSPPAWGKLVAGRAEALQGGNIPTCVGKTDPEFLFEVLDKETSPPAWGKLSSLPFR